MVPGHGGVITPVTIIGKYFGTTKGKVTRRRELSTARMIGGERTILSRSSISWVIRFGPGERRAAGVDFSLHLLLQSATKPQNRYAIP